MGRWALEHLEDLQCDTGILLLSRLKLTRGMGQILSTNCANRASVTQIQVASEISPEAASVLRIRMRSIASFVERALWRSALLLCPHFLKGDTK